jgi:hypothetical protein
MASQEDRRWLGKEKSYETIIEAGHVWVNSQVGGGSPVGPVGLGPGGRRRNREEAVITGLPPAERPGRRFYEGGRLGPHRSFPHRRSEYRWGDEL